MFQLGAPQYEQLTAGPKYNGYPRGAPTISTQPTQTQVKPPPRWNPPRAPSPKPGVPVVTQVPAGVITGAPPQPQPMTAGATITVDESWKTAWRRMALLVALSALGTVGGIAAWRRYRK